MKKVAITLMMVSVFAMVGCQEQTREMMIEKSISGELQPVVSEVKAEMEKDLGTKKPEDVQLAKRLSDEMEEMARDLNQTEVTTEQEKAILVSRNDAATAKKLALKIKGLKNQATAKSYLQSIEHKIDRIQSYKEDSESRKIKSIEKIDREKERVAKAKDLYDEWKVATKNAGIDIPQLDEAVTNGIKRVEEKIAEKERLLTSYESDLNSILSDVEQVYVDAQQIGIAKK